MTQKSKRPGRQTGSAKDDTSSTKKTHPSPPQNENHPVPDGTVTLSIGDLLSRAKDHIVAGENRLRLAAEDIALASGQGATQTEIAERVGKSQSWVSGLLKWRSAGYPETAFGPQSKARRRADDQAPNNPNRKPKKEVDSDTRTRLVKILGMLGSEQDGECLNAAHMADQLRKKLNMDWDELIIKATKATTKATETQPETTETPEEQPQAVAA